MTPCLRDTTRRRLLHPCKPIACPSTILPPQSCFFITSIISSINNFYSLTSTANLQFELHKQSCSSLLSLIFFTSSDIHVKTLCNHSLLFILFLLTLYSFRFSFLQFCYFILCTTSDLFLFNSITSFYLSLTDLSSSLIQDLETSSFHL